ncbi:MAG: hypothetical protein HY907_04060 [Deltaproteobacteria bacterium]|nr:hypothetical protein [Deltaproteobacteria bacterium]
MKLLTVIVALGMLLGAAPVAAQEEDQDNLPFVAYTFGDELVRTELLRPDDIYTTVRDRRPTISLIKIRLNFMQELFKSGENL